MPSVLFFSFRQISAHPIRNFHSSQSTPGRFDNIENAIFLHFWWIFALRLNFTECGIVKTVTNMKIFSVKCKKRRDNNNIKVKSNVKSCYKYENFKYPNLRPIFSAARKSIFGKMVSHPKQVLKSNIKKLIN